MRPPARAIVGNLIWSRDGGVWGLWRIAPFPHAHTAMTGRLAVHGRIRGLLLSLPADAMLLSVCARLDSVDVVGRMVEGIDLDQRPAWREVCDLTNTWLDQTAMHQRRYYVAAALANVRRPMWDVLRDAGADVSAAFGIGPKPVVAGELEVRRRQARELEARMAQYATLSPVPAAEVCWLHARALRREAGEPSFDERWEPPVQGRHPTDPRGPDDPTMRERWRPRGVLAHLIDVVVKEGGSAYDADRPRHRRYVRVDGPGGVSYQTVLTLADPSHDPGCPGGGGEWLYHLDQVGFPVDWCVRVRSVPDVDAPEKVRRQHRELTGQVDEHHGEPTGTPPPLAEVIPAIDDERTERGANPAEPELRATILMSVAARRLVDLEDRAGALTSTFEAQEHGLGRPSGSQLALLRSMLPGTAAAPVCRDYAQLMPARDLAAARPFCGPAVGDPRGLLLGRSPDTGPVTPVLFDPAYGPEANASPSLAAAGRMGSGKSFFLKRLCWDTIARGGQVVTIDRSRSGEYVSFARAVPGRVQLVRLGAGADVCLDPLRNFSSDEGAAVTLGFLSLLAGTSAPAEEGAALAEAVDAVALRPDSRVGDVLDELERMGARSRHPDYAARRLARRLTRYRRSAAGQLAFGAGQPPELDADLIVFWAPHLALPPREALDREPRGGMMRPNQVLGQALLYLVAAVGLRVVFGDPSRFAAALYDEAWALLASSYGQSLLIEGVRHGRRHNGAIWLASQDPTDFAVSDLQDLLGPRFVFRQARSAIPGALHLLGAAGSVDATTVLEQGLGNGQCLYRDVRDRVGLIQVLPPALPDVGPTFERPLDGARADPADPSEDKADDAAAPAPTRRRRRTPLAQALAERSQT